MTTPPRLPPVASATRRKVAVSTMVNSLKGDAVPVDPTRPALCETNNNPCSGVPVRPKARLSMSLSKVSTVSARWRLVKRTTWRRSGHVTAHSVPSAATARLLTRKFSSRLNWVKMCFTGSKVETPLLVLT